MHRSRRSAAVHPTAIAALRAIELQSGGRRQRAATSGKRGPIEAEGAIRPRVRRHRRRLPRADDHPSPAPPSAAAPPPVHAAAAADACPPSPAAAVAWRLGVRRRRRVGASRRQARCRTVQPPRAIAATVAAAAGERRGCTARKSLREGRVTAPDVRAPPRLSRRRRRGALLRTAALHRRGALDRCAASPPCRRHAPVVKRPVDLQLSTKVVEGLATNEPQPASGVVQRDCESAHRRAAWTSAAANGVTVVHFDGTSRGAMMAIADGANYDTPQAELLERDRRLRLQRRLARCRRRASTRAPTTTSRSRRAPW